MTGLDFVVQYLKRHSKLFNLSILFLVVESLCDLLQPTMMARIVDVGVANRDLDVVLRLGLTMLLITLIGALGAVGRNILSSVVSQRFGSELRFDLFAKIQRLSLGRLSQFETASLITRLTNDVTQVQEFVHRLMRIFVRAPILAIGAAMMASYLSPKLAIVLAVVIPVATILVTLNLKVGFPFFRRVQRAIDRLNQSLREYLSGVRVVKAFNRNSYEIQRFKAVNQEVTDSTVQAERVMAFFSPTIILTVNMGIVAVLWFGGQFVQLGTMEVGKIIAFVNYMTQMLNSLMRIFMVFTRFVRARASAERIGEVFERDEGKAYAGQRSSQGIQGGIAFQGVSFAYPGSTGDPILKGVSFETLPGETIGIIGPTGAGKTTLISLIPRLYDPTEGVLAIDGLDSKTLKASELREDMAIVPQKSLLFTGSIAENIRWGNQQASLEEVKQAAELAQIAAFIEELPLGYESVVGQGGVNLSGGQKQRLAIARALVRKPRILILDDCTSALDLATEARILRGLKDYTEDLTCFVISQRITSVMAADRILVLDEGRVAGFGNHQELLASCLVYQDIFRSQIGRKEAV